MPCAAGQVLAIVDPYLNSRLEVALTWAFIIMHVCALWATLRLVVVSKQLNFERIKLLGKKFN